MKITNVKLKVAGVTFPNEDGISRQNTIKLIAKENQDMPVVLEREPTNSYDRNAIKVVTPAGQVGYIGKDYAGILAPMMDEGKQFTATIAEIGEYKDTWHMQININEV